MSKRPGDPGYAAGWCIHYRNPMDSTECEAGVPWSSIREIKYQERPCFLTATGESKPGAASCAMLRRPTPEEIAAHDEWVKARWLNTAKVLEAIQPWREENRGKGGSLKRDCPACGGKGTLSLAMAARNGHCMGRCTTSGCVSWNE